MATAEIGLNEALAEHGIAAWETDLAELIVQLGEDLPSHILVPAIHRNRAEIREIFRTKMAAAGRPAPSGLTDDPAELAGAARLHLREKFLRAKVAVSGANFAIAETGTLVVVESEGNGRMCLTLPEVLISVVGIEKVVPTWADLDAFLRLLPRSSTGERMNPYTSTWSGVTPGDGPQEVHVVLLDNGRTRALADDVGRQALRCIRCSACLNVCPVYERVGGHAYGSVYPGPIGAILNPLMKGTGVDEQTDSLPYASSLCGACFEVCPVRIDIPEVLVHLRSKVVDGHRGDTVPKAEAVAMKSAAWAFGDARRLALAERASGLAGRVLARVGRTTLPGGRPAAGRLPGPGLPGPVRATCPPRPRVLPGLVAPHEGGPLVSARDDILGRVRSALAGVEPDGARCRRRRGVLPCRPATRRSSTCSRSGSRTTARSWRGVRRPTSSRRCSLRCPRARGSSYLPASASRCPARSSTTGCPPSSWTGSTRWSPGPGSASPRPAPSSWTTDPARAAARSRWSPTGTSASSGPTRSWPTSPTRSPCSTP